MPPKKIPNKNPKKLLEVTESAKHSELKECSMCHEKIKSCLLKDHLATKCSQRMNQIGKKKKRNLSSEDDDEVVFLGASNNKNDLTQKLQIDTPKEYALSMCKTEQFEVVANNFSLESNFLRLKSEKVVDLEIETEICVEITSSVKEECNESFEKRRRSIKRLRSEEENETIPVVNTALITIHLNENNQVKSESIEIVDEVKSEKLTENTDYSNDFDFYLNNFTNAIQSVLAEETFACLLNEEDYETIENFSSLTSDKFR